MNNYTKIKRISPQSDFNDGITLIKKHYTKREEAIIKTALENGVSTQQLAHGLSKKTGHSITNVYTLFKLKGASK